MDCETASFFFVFSESFITPVVPKNEGSQKYKANF